MSKKRLLYLDNLKVCLTVLVVFHHAGQAYGDGGDWAYHPSNPAEFMPWFANSANRSMTSAHRDLPSSAC